MARKKSLTSLEQAVLDKIAEFNAGQEQTIIPYMRDRLGDLVIAARLINEGRYGKCVECDADIPLARLQVKPEAVRCMPCQARHEQVPAAVPAQMRSAS